MRPQPYSSRPVGAVSTREACFLADVDRVTIWRWITQDGLRYWREPEHPHGYYYDPRELQEMKRKRAARKIARPKRPAAMYDYT